MDLPEYHVDAESIDAFQHALRDFGKKYGLKQRVEEHHELWKGTVSLRLERRFFEFALMLFRDSVYLACIETDRKTKLARIIGEVPVINDLYGFIRQRQDLLFELQVPSDDVRARTGEMLEEALLKLKERQGSP